MSESSGEPQSGCRSAVIGGLIAILIVGAFAVVLIRQLTVKGSYDIAEYPEFSISSLYGGELSFGGFDRPAMHPMYFKLPDGTVKSSNEIRPEDITYFCEDRHTTEHKGGEIDFYRPITGNHTTFAFEKRRVVYVSLDSHEIAFSRLPEGPFLTLPVTKTEMIEAFGKPNWRKAQVAAP